jgi:hypothetical protein
MIDKIFLDMDGTIANLYAVQGWLPMLRAYDPTPYAQAEPMVNMALLARYIHKVQRLGIKVCILSWLSKTSTPQYDEQVIKAKREWLRKHLPSVSFDEIHIVPYGVPKYQFATHNSFLIDDEDKNLIDWDANVFYGCGIQANEIMNFLQSLQ